MSSLARLSFQGAIVLSLTSPSAAFALSADSIGIGIIATEGALAVVYFVAFIVAFICLFQTSGRRTPYAVLFPVPLLLTLGALAYTAVVVFDYGSPFLRDVHNALWVTSVFLINWAQALFYLALVLITRERIQKADKITQSTAQRGAFVAFAVGYIWFGILLGLGTADGVLLNGALTRRNGYSIWETLRHAWQGAYFATAFHIAALAYLSYRHARRADVRDKISNVMAFIIAPIYGAYIVAEMVFYILLNLPNSPFQRPDLVFLIGLPICGVFFIAALFAVLTLGLKSRSWLMWGGVDDHVSHIATPKLGDDHSDLGLSHVPADYRAASVYSNPASATATASPAPLLPPHYQSTPLQLPRQGDPTDRPLSYTSAGSQSIGPEQTYTYVGEVDSLTPGYPQRQPPPQQFQPQQQPQQYYRPQ